MKKEPTKPAQISLLLRMVGGGYLLYLAWDLREAFRDGPHFIICAVIFALAGAVLLGHCIYKFVKKEYIPNTPYYVPVPPKDEEKSEECEDEIDE